MTPRSVPHDSDFKMCPSAFLPNSPPIDNPKTTRAQGQRGKVKGPQEFTALFQARTHKPLIFQAGRERSLKGTEGRSERQASGSSKLFSTHRSLNGKRIHARKSRESSSNLAHPVSGGANGGPENCHLPRSQSNRYQHPGTRADIRTKPALSPPSQQVEMGHRQSRASLNPKGFSTRLEIS